MGDFLRPEALDDLFAFGQNLAKAQAAFPKLVDRETLGEYLCNQGELAPVNSVVGGILANEVLKAVSKKGDPVDNLFLFSIANGVGTIEKLAPVVKKTRVMSDLAKQV